MFGARVGATFLMMMNVCKSSGLPTLTTILQADEFFCSPCGNSTAGFYFLLVYEIQSILNDGWEGILLVMGGKQMNATK